VETVVAVRPFDIGDLVIPTSVDSDDARDFVEMTRVRNEVRSEAAGCHDLDVTPEELLPSWRAQRFSPKRLLVARVANRVVARAVAELPPGSPVAWVSVEVLRGFRHHGIGSALYERVEREAVLADRAVLQSYVVQGVSTSVDRVLAPTGFGSVPRDSDITRFVLARGFGLEQVARMSRLHLPADRHTLRRRYAQAIAAAGPDYRIIHWAGRTPESRLAQVAELRARLATDAPQAGLEPGTAPWTPERVRAEDDILAAGTVHVLTALAEHVPSGRAAGYTELRAPADLERPVGQGDTIVTQEHRGHRLGIVLKIANLLRLEEARPGHPSVVTFTAEENRNMLQVNDVLGFVPWGYQSAWKKVLRG
jgi:GNAT superfamily N-acetyltransferase